jgi:hypothetical protein
MPNPEEIDGLDPSSTGRWLIVAGSGSCHVLDLDDRTYERRPGPTSQPFPHDLTPVPFTRIQVWPRLGGRMLVWFDDPAIPGLVEHFRVSSRISRIVRDSPKDSAPSGCAR